MIGSNMDTMLCPFARTFGVKEAQPYCRGQECALWRWQKVTTAHPMWLPAVRKRADETGEKAPFPKAVRWVTDNLAELGIKPTHGYCGAGGEP